MAPPEEAVSCGGGRPEPPGWGWLAGERVARGWCRRRLACLLDVADADVAYWEHRGVVPAAVADRAFMLFATPPALRQAYRSGRFVALPAARQEAGWDTRVAAQLFGVARSTWVAWEQQPASAAAGWAATRLVAAHPPGGDLPAARVDAGLSAEKAARLAGVSARTWQRWEHLDRRPPLARLRPLAAVLDVEFLALARRWGW